MKSKGNVVAKRLVSTGSSLAIGIALSTASFASAVQAQEAGDTSDNVTEGETIVVTGSRLPSGNAQSPQPISSLGEEAFEATGALTVSEAIAELPQLGDALEGGSSINALNSGFGVGTQTVNLRGLGANRTLVLVNSRRHVGGDVGTSAVDLATIPSALVERIDVVTGANSAVYGADAVTGVVNVVLKSDYDGTEISGRYGITSEGDGQEFALSAVHGGSFGNGEYIFAAEYSKQNEIVGADRSFSQFDGSAATGLSDVNNGSGVNPGGLFAFSGGGVGGFNAAGQFTQPFAERFQRVPFRSLQDDTERLIISGRGSVDLSADITGFAEATWANTKVNVQFDPQLAIFSDAGFASSGTAGFRFPSATAVLQPDLGGTLRPITRRFLEFGPRRAEIDRTLFRLAAGLDGDWSAGKWHFSYQYGQVDADQTDFNTIDKFRLVSAIDPAECATISGCQFVDLFGRGTIDPASLDFVSDDLVSSSKSEQHSILAYISGDAFDLPAGSIGYVLGAEFRDESATVRPNDGLIAITNPITGTGLVGAKGTRTFFGDTDGGYNVLEGFAEARIPLFADADLGLSARVSDYSTVGTEFTWGANFDWQIVDALRLRTSYGRATRAPNILELFAPEQVATAAIADPCDTQTDAGAPLTQAAGCSNFVSATYNPTDLDQQIRGVSGGNPDLDSETADTFTIGAVLTLGRTATLSVDYFDISLDNVLAPAFSAQATLNRCISTQDPFFCDNVERGANDFVTSVRSEQVNLARESVAGIDVVLQLLFPLGDGDLSLNANWTHLTERDRQVNDEVAVEDLVGRIDNLKNRIRTTLAYEGGPVRFGTTLRYLDGGVQSISADPTVALGNDVPSRTYVDLFASFDLNETIAFNAGIENVFDESAPIVTDLFENNGSADTVASGIYDIRGTFFYIGATARF
jgi:outer membrane receptor protein involved in Fe transport